MEEGVREPLLGQIVEDENQEYSVWFLYLKDSIARRDTAVNRGYRNRDFRKSDGSPVVDRETYRKLRNDADDISHRLSTSHWVLYFFLVLTVKGLRGHVSVLGFLGAFSLALIVFHFVSRNVLFKKADAELLALIESYHEHFLETHGITLHHHRCTKLFRWWSDDSGLYLRRPRTSLIPATGSNVEESDWTFSPIYIHRRLPGTVNIHEMNHDTSIKVDANAWALLQSIQKEMLQPSSFDQGFHVIVKHAVFVYLVGYTWFGDSALWMINGLAVLFVVLMMGFEVVDRRNQRIYQEITQRVNEALQKDENTAHLTLEYHDSTDSWDRRYQFEQQGAKERTVDPTNLIGQGLHYKMQEHSVWFMYLRDSIFRKDTAVNPSYRNSDFRKSDGTPLVDQETYRLLKSEIDHISRDLLDDNHGILVFFFILTLAVKTLFGRVLLSEAVGVYSLVLIFCQHVSDSFFQDYDARLLALMTAYQEHFSSTHGVTLHHHKCTNRFRWWNDDSGLYLRCARTPLIRVAGSGVEASDGAFSPIYIHLKVPGHVHIEEKSHDASIKVDAHAFELLQSIHKEMLQLPRFCPSFNFEINHIMFVYLVGSIWWFINCFWAIAFFFIYKAGAHVQDERNQGVYQEITQRVNASLQKDENTAHLTLEYHNAEFGSRRYQFVQAAGMH